MPVILQVLKDNFLKIFFLEYFRDMKMLVPFALLFLSFLMLFGCKEEESLKSTSKIFPMAPVADARERGVNGYEFEFRMYGEETPLFQRSLPELPLLVQNEVLAEGHSPFGSIYLFNRENGCLGVLYTDLKGALKYFNPRIICADSSDFLPKNLYVRWNGSVPVYILKENSGERGSDLRIGALDGKGGVVFVETMASNTDACGPEEDEGVLPCFENETEVSLPLVGSVLPDTLFTETHGTVLDESRRVVEVDEKDTLVLPWRESKVPGRK